MVLHKDLWCLLSRSLATCTEWAHLTTPRWRRFAALWCRLSGERTRLCIFPTSCLSTSTSRWDIQITLFSFFSLFVCVLSVSLEKGDCTEHGHSAVQKGLYGLHPISQDCLWSSSSVHLIHDGPFSSFEGGSSNASSFDMWKCAHVLYCLIKISVLLCVLIKY